MIKRRLYKLKDEASDSSSSSSSESESEPEPQESESEPEPQKEEDEEAAPLDELEEEEEEAPPEEEDVEEDVPDIQKIPSSPSSGYESEDSSEKEVEYDSSGDEETGVAQFGRRATKHSTDSDYTGRTLKINSVYKCRLCPRIVCFSEESLSAHLNSKRHARSEKLLNEGRLKMMLNSDGELEEDQETHAERHARTVAIAQVSNNKKKNNRGRQRQRLRLLKRKKTGDAPDKPKTKEDVPDKPKTKKDAPDKKKTKEPAKNPKKKRRKSAE